MPLFGYCKTTGGWPKCLVITMIVQLGMKPSTAHPLFKVVAPDFPNPYYHYQYENSRVQHAIV